LTILQAQDGRLFEFVTETGSTNADLAARLRAGEPLAEDTWLIADRQSDGKGRQGRDWIGGEGNFMGSTVVKLTGREASPSCLAMVAGLAVYETVFVRLPLPAKLELKWPNDLLLAGGKLAGILLERHGDTVIVGIGVNLAQSPRLARNKAISLGQFGPVPDRDIFAADLAQNFVKEVERWRKSGINAVLARWLAAAHPEGTPLTVHTGDATPISGVFAGLAPDGALKLRLADGAVRVIHAGDVSRGGG
jgi:BirA family biotin operon repressor/biotin-[acetyl-CoA-carboxylase] ligase